MYDSIALRRCVSAKYATEKPLPRPGPGVGFVNYAPGTQSVNTFPTGRVIAFPSLPTGCGRVFQLHILSLWNVARLSSYTFSESPKSPLSNKKNYSHLYTLLDFKDFFKAQPTSNKNYYDIFSFALISRDQQCIFATKCNLLCPYRNSKIDIKSGL